MDGKGGRKVKKKNKNSNDDDNGDGEDGDDDYDHDNDNDDKQEQCFFSSFQKIEKTFTMDEHLTMFFSNSNEQAMKKKYRMNITNAMPTFNRHLNEAIVMITNNSIKNNNITEQIIPDELTVT